MSPPRVSICVPTWNGASHVAEALESALAQTHADFELLVVDDASPDRTLEVVASFRDPRLAVHRNDRRLGLPGNWNRCLSLARGPYVKFLFQDDLLAPTAVERLLTALEGAPGAPLAFCRREIRYEGPGLEAFPLKGGYYDSVLQGFYASFRGTVAGRALVASALEEGRPLPINVVGEPSFVLLRRDAALKAGGFDDSFEQLPDWDLWLRLAQEGPLVLVDESLGVFRVHGRSQSASFDRLRVLRENVRLMTRVRRGYGPVLDAANLRRLAWALWRCRLAVVREAVPSLVRGWRVR